MAYTGTKAGSAELGVRGNAQTSEVPSGHIVSDIVTVLSI